MKLSTLLAGVRKFSNDMEFMLGKKPNALLRLSWGLLTPVVMIVLVGFYLYGWTPIVYNNTEPYPVWADNVGIVLAAFPIILIPLLAVVRVCSTKVSQSSHMQVLLT